VDLICLQFIEVLRNLVCFSKCKVDHVEQIVKAISHTKIN
jgi:hypothetical protein